MRFISVNPISKLKIMKIILIYIFFIYTILYAQYREEDKKSLSIDKTWLSLLHYGVDGKKSTILSKRFFLSSEGNLKPEEELKATIHAYKTNKRNIICKYPARYLWLSEKLEWKDYSQKISQCYAYKNWDLIHNVSSVSAVFVNGFLGNPASSFGHSFIKLNKKNLNKKNSNQNTLLDHTISYGAKLPKKYTMLSYIYNGLTGGYTAAYTDQYYYMNDMAYSNQEFRDMWEYQLNMTDAKKKLFLAHLWELRGVEFQYFFLNRNCGYMVSELLDIVYDEHIRNKALGWYVPSETFYTLERYGNKIESVIYHPSLQQEVYAFYDDLTQKQKKKVEDFIISEDKHPFLKQFTSKELDFLLEYYTYALSTIKNTDSQYLENKEAKQILLRTRIKMPVSDYIKPSPPIKRSITENNPPARISFGVKTLKDEKSSAYIRLSPFSIDALGYNEYEGDIFSLFDIAMSIRNTGASLTSVDIINIRRLKVNKIPFDIDNPLSWRLNIGMKKNKNWDVFASGGVGYTWQITQQIKCFSFLNFSLHSKEETYQISPTIGMFADYNHFKMSYEFSKAYKISDGLLRNTQRLNVSYNLDKQKSIFLKYTVEDKQEIICGMKWFF
jgi:hypothetical protein